jgi:amino acid transporter
MHSLLAALFAADFKLNVPQALATGVIGGGAALMFGAVAQLFAKPKPPAEGQPAAKKASPLVLVLLFALGLVLVFVGVVWRVSSQEPTRR